MDNSGRPGVLLDRNGTICEDMGYLNHISRLVLLPRGAGIDAYYHCPHHPHGRVASFHRACDCRKPEPKLAERAAEDLRLELHRSYVVDDKHVDIELAARIRARGILVLTGYGRGEWKWNTPQWTHAPDAVVEDLYDAARWILQA